MNEPQSDDTIDESLDPVPQDDGVSNDEAFQDADFGDTTATEETRDEEMDRLRGEVEEANKRVLQAQAEAENFRKRMRRDYEDQLKYASMPLVVDVLQVCDNLNRALDAAKSSEESGATSGLQEGVAMVAKQLGDTFAKHGIKPIPADGEQFDPNYHEAISQMPSPDVPEGAVAHVAVAGFQMHDRVIRPAQVVVSTGDGA